MGRTVGLIASVSWALSVFALATPAGAATITPDVEFDGFQDPVGVGQAPTCTLREAVQAANTDATFDGCARAGAGGLDKIVLQAGGTYTLNRAGIDDSNSGGDLDLLGKTTIEVPGAAQARIEGGGVDRVIDVRPDASLLASKLAITGGLVDEPELAAGGAISNSGRLELSDSSLFDNQAQRAAVACGCGGAIANGSEGRMVLRRVSISHNSATHDGGGIYSTGEAEILASAIDGANSAFNGGGILVADGSVRLVRSTVADNESTFTDASFPNTGGGGINVQLGDLAIVNSTVSGNRSATRGGGIELRFGDLDMNATTVTGNTADSDANGSGHGGGLSGALFGVDSTQLRSRNSIVAGNLDLNPTTPAPDCAMIDSGFGARNLLGQGGGCPAAGSDRSTADPRLKPLGDNGGPTQTHALRKRSPAVGKAGRKNSPKRDQRGRKRDEHPDIGAYER